MRFLKMEGVGNHFVVLDSAHLRPDWLLSELAIRLCEYRFGPGADGLLVGSVTGDPAVPVQMRMFNPDGTEDMCGNGLRCICLWALRMDAVSVGSPFLVRTKEGDRAVTILSADAQRLNADVTVDMGAPRFSPEDIPIAIPQSGAAPLGPRNALQICRQIDVDRRSFDIIALNTGSTHTVIFGDPPTEEDFHHYSPLIEVHPLFPERTSVLWATPFSASESSNDIAVFAEDALRAPLEVDRIAVRIWERGVGETFGCGTGACAVGVAARVADCLSVRGMSGDASNSRPIDVISRGGILKIDWTPNSVLEPLSGTISMTGPARTIYSGDIALD